MNCPIEFIVHGHTVAVKTNSGNDLRIMYFESVVVNKFRTKFAERLVLVLKSRCNEIR